MQLGGSSLPRKRIQSLLMGLDSRPGLLSARVTFFRGDDKKTWAVRLQLERAGGFRLATVFPAFANKTRACGSSSTAFRT